MAGYTGVSGSWLNSPMTIPSLIHSVGEHWAILTSISLLNTLELVPDWCIQCASYYRSKEGVALITEVRK